MRPLIAATIVIASLLTSSAAHAEDLDGDGTDDAGQRAKICGIDGERPVCDELVRSLIAGDTAAFLKVAAVDAAHPLRVERRRRKPATYRDAKGLEDAIAARGGLRPFFSGTKQATGTRVHLGGRGDVLEHDVTVGAVTARLRFENDDGFHLTRIAFR